MASEEFNAKIKEARDVLWSEVYALYPSTQQEQARRKMRNYTAGERAEAFRTAITIINQMPAFDRLKLVYEDILNMATVDINGKSYVNQNDVLMKIYCHIIASSFCL